MTEPTEAMIEAGTLVFFGLIERKEIDPVSIYLAMKALDPDTHRASSDEVERIARVIRAEFDAMERDKFAVEVASEDEALNMVCHRLAAALAAIPIPATGEVEKLTPALAHIRRLALSDIGATYDLILGATDAALAAVPAPKKPSQ